MRRDLALVAALLLALALVAPPAHAQNPAEGEPGHDHAAHQQTEPGMRAPPQNTASEDAALPVGSIETVIVDPDGKPLANVPVTLGIVENSVAKGESRKRELGVSGADGKLRWNALQTGSGFAYRISVAKEGATFAVSPFQLGPERGMTTKLHVFPIVKSLEDAVILSKAAVYAEIKDDRVQIEQMITIANFGQTAWVPDDFTMQVPPGFRAFTTEQGMSDVGVDKLENKNEIKLRGTFSPGQHQIVYRWQLPYAGESEVSFEVEAPPHLAQARVLAAAAQKMKLESEGMGAAQTEDLQGQRVLVIDWDQLSAKGGALTNLRVHLRDVPESGLPTWLMRSGFATASLVALSAIVVLRSGKRQTDARTKKDRRTALLDELAELERAHASGDVGPKTYERARRELIDQIALTLAVAS